MLMKIKTGFAFLLALFLPAIGFGQDVRLVDAARNGDRTAVRSLIQQGVNVNVIHSDGATALAWAANRDDLELADLLIRAGANANLANEYGVTPVALACINRSAVMVEKLLGAGADPNSASWTGETPLMVCARTGNVQAVKALLSRGANPDAKENQQGHTALMRAVAERHSGIVRALVDARADIAARSRGGFTALLFAGQQGDMESTRTLIAAGADVNEATPEHGTALVLAAASGREDVALFLLEKGANPNAVDAYGLSALHYAVPKGLASIDSVSVVFRPHEDVPANMPGLVKALLARGANPNLQVTKDFPPYSRSPYALQTSLVGLTPFLMAAASGDVELMRILLDRGADPLLKLREGSTALMLAAGVGRVDDRPAKDEANALEAVKSAFEVVGNLDAVNARGRSALHGAAGIGANAIIQFLAEKGANLELKDRQGTTALKIAAGGAPRGDGANRVYPATMEVLIKLGADRESINAPEISQGRRTATSAVGGGDDRQD